MNDASLNERLLDSYVPLCALTADHLATLLRARGVETVLAGTRLFDIGDTDGDCLYLLHGTVALESAGGEVLPLSFDAPQCRFPLADRQPRQVGARALSDCSVLRLPAAVLDSMLCWDQAARSLRLTIAEQPSLDASARWMLALLESNLFHTVPPVHVRDVLDAFHAQPVQAGERVILQGQSGDACYFLRAGEAEVIQEPTGHCLARLGPGRVFGEDALVHDTVRSASVVMRTDGLLMRLERQDFIRLLRKPSCRWINLPEARQQASEGAIWLDVRTQDEFEAGHHPGAGHLPLDLLSLKSRLLDRQRPYLLYCNSGQRSGVAQYLLQAAGFEAWALAGGFDACAEPERADFLSETGDVPGMGTGHDGGAGR